MKIFIEEKDKGANEAILWLSNKEAKNLMHLVEEGQKKMPDLKKIRRLSKQFYGPMSENLAVY